MCVPVFQLETEFNEAREIFLASGQVITSVQREIQEELRGFSTFGDAPVPDDRVEYIREKLREMRTPVKRFSLIAEEWRKMESEAFALY